MRPGGSLAFVALLVLFSSSAFAASPNAAEWLESQRQETIKMSNTACWSGRINPIIGDGKLIFGEMSPQDKYLMYSNSGRCLSQEGNSELNELASRRFPGSQFNCCSATGALRLPTKTYFMEDYHVTRVETLGKAGGQIVTTFSPSSGATVDYDGRGNQIQILVDENGRAEVVGLHMDRFSAEGSNATLTKERKHSFRENELVQAANILWARASDVPPDEFINNLFGNANILSLFGSFAERVHSENRTNPEETIQ